MRLGSMKCCKESDPERFRCGKSRIREGMDAGRFWRAGVLMVLVSPLLAREFVEEYGGHTWKGKDLGSDRYRDRRGAPRFYIYSSLYH